MILSSFCLLFSNVLANSGSMWKAIEGAINQANGLSDFDRNLSDDFLFGASNLDKIDEYACWCFFGSAYEKGSGYPQNAIDEMCRQLHYGYECIIRDSVDDGTVGCVPWEVDYTFTVLAQIAIPNVLAHFESECLDLDLCAVRSCRVEMKFSKTYFFLWFDNVIDRDNGTFEPADQSLKHSNNFDAETECVIDNIRPEGEPDKLCCGSYPDRFPYTSFNGSRQCCGGKTYSTALFLCCDIFGTGPPQLNTSCL